MMYTVGEIAKLLNVAPSTLRYYDKEGLLPFIERSGGGMRMFKESDYEWLKVIDCLKKTGMPIKNIKLYIEMAMQGDSTIDERLELFTRQRDAVKLKMKDLQDTLDLLDYKCWFYEVAKQSGSTITPQNISLEDLPEHIREVRQNMINKF